MDEFDFLSPPLLTRRPEADMQALHSYLFQLREQLGTAMITVERSVADTQRAAEKSAAVLRDEQKPSNVFARLKDLIIKSADIVDAYSEKIEKRLDGHYVAVSDFGTYTEQTAALFAATSEQIAQMYTNLQIIESNVEGIESAQREVNAYIRTGHIYDDEAGVPRYGLEIGEQLLEDGAESFKKYLRITSDRMSFFDSNGMEVAYISDKILHITEANVRTLTAETVTVAEISMGPYSWKYGSDGHLTLA